MLEATVGRRTAFWLGPSPDAHVHFRWRAWLRSSSSSRISSKQQSPRASPSPGPVPSQPPQDEGLPGEPSEEDVARAFSIYDEDAIGEISTSSLDGEFCAGLM